MDETTGRDREPRWYHLLPSWWPVAAFLVAAFVSGVEAYGQIADQGKRIDKLEALSPELDHSLHEIKARQEDETARLDRIENKLDRAVSLGTVPH